MINNDPSATGDRPDEFDARRNFKNRADIDLEKAEKKKFKNTDIGGTHFPK